MIEFKENYFDGVDDVNIYYYSWIPKKKLKGVIQMAHGMCEKGMRYEDTAIKLAGAGYAVYINDHRGHGKSAWEEYGYLGSGDVFLKMVKDMKTLTDIIKDEHKDEKLFLLGHSMGSFLSLRYLEVYGKNLNGIIFSGTGGTNKIGNTILCLGAKLSVDIFGERRKAIYINKITNRVFNKRIDKVINGAEWLTRDKKAAQLYSSYEDTGFVFTSSAYHYLFKGMNENFLKSNLEAIPKDIPIYLFSGSEDPVGDYAEGVKKIYNMYKEELKIEDVTLRIYEGGRHEMLNEINKDEVVEHLINWLDEKTSILEK